MHGMYPLKIFKCVQFFVNHPVYHLTILYSARHGNIGCFGRNLQYFGNKFLRLMYSDITKHTYIYPRFNSNGDNDAWKMWSSCDSTYCTCSTCCVNRTLRRPSLRRYRSQAMRRRVCYAEHLETWGRSLWKLVRGFIVYLMSFTSLVC
jgi:hypothetical protein